MTPIAIVPRSGAIKDLYSSTVRAGSPHIQIAGVSARAQNPAGASFLGNKTIVSNSASADRGKRNVATEDEYAARETGSDARPTSAKTESIEKIVRRIPTLYVITFFGVVVGCAVLIIWNTLQVNTLTLELGHLQDKNAQTEQRLIKLKAQEMQLSAPSRIREIAKTKLGMIEETGEDLVIVR
jgi:cell division protein FtsL